MIDLRTGFVRNHPMSGDLPDEVFISYRRASESEVAEALANRLSSRHCTVFLDRDTIRGGEKLPERILNALQDALIAVPLFSAGYFTDADWTLRELDTMLELNVPIVPVLCGIRPEEIPPHYAYLRQRICLDWRGDADDVARQLAATIEDRRHEVKHDLPLLARAAAAVISTDPQAALAAIAVPFVLPPSTSTDRWYYALRWAGARRRTLLRNAVSLRSEHDPRVRFLARSVQSAVSSTEIFPARGEIEAEMAKVAVGLRRDRLIAELHAEALQAVAPRFARQLGIVQAADLDARLANLTDPAVIFAAAADALFVSGVSPASLVAQADTHVMLALLTTVARWRDGAVDDLIRDLRHDADVTSRFERARRRLWILRDAGYAVSAEVDLIAEGALEEDVPGILPGILEAADEQRLTTYGKLVGISGETSEQLLWTIRRLVECGADSESLPEDVAIAVSAATSGAPDNAVESVATESSAQRFWLKIVGPELTDAQLIVLRDVAGRSRAVPSGTANRDAASALLRAAEFQERKDHGQ